ncbi:uncharacterized protein TRIVIDRAFT_66108 [Trichoderma virens Gv29-8]|uniref:Uncharacterized protein n=1 Tax=Hypocrea virens (strain Gv29-8 / FGSC 10586) TaxID=413071 RepID=G9N842_HYPVG|nr:uncharacterized protein TRIVIDRAFT_66108 [Trichoderma virens Gv29-8]EHK17397.1 hypothetical protein TRIVIDRAFT_66108 [Trichoderma virens Gv29-8]UKZ55569.1 hypothetical protein TrVGV298_009393 [Trichoderma virens]
MKRMILAAALVGGAAALVANKPIKATNTDCGIICTDEVNECGQKFGGCYDPCVDPVPTPPPCTVPYVTSWHPTPMPTPTSPVEIYNCSAITVCVDGINSCGIPFGGCFPDCKPWNIIVPPCPEDDIDAVPFNPFNPIPSTPASETPPSDIPASETPAPESPALEAPVLEVPFIESPVAEVDEDADGPVPWIPGDFDDWFD